MADAYSARWQNKTIVAKSDFRGPLTLALPIAAFWFLWQWLSLPGTTVLSDLPPLLRFAMDKARYMPDFALILAGFAVFHFQRGLKEEWDRSVAWRLYLRLLTPALAMGVLALVLYELVLLLAPGHHLSKPWSDPLVGPVFWIMATVVVFMGLLPSVLYWTWTCIPDVCWAAVAICFAFYGLSFSDGFHHYLWLWPVIAVFDVMLGIALCSTLFRAVEWLSAVRGPAIILGWVALAAGAILSGPALFFVGFTMILGGMAIGERDWYIPVEKWLLAWSRTALPFMLVQPAALAAWSAWGPASLHPRWLAAVIAAAVTQLVALACYSLVIRPARHLFTVRTADAAAP